MKYETPEIVEIGRAKDLVLGSGGAYADCCACSGKKDPDIDDDDESI